MAEVDEIQEESDIMTHHEKRIELRGVIFGPTWEGHNSSLTVEKIRRPGESALSMVKRATSCGDFESCALTADSEFLFIRTLTRTDKDSRIFETVTRERRIVVTRFPSVASEVGSKESYEVEVDES